MRFSDTYKVNVDLLRARMIHFAPSSKEMAEVFLNIGWQPTYKDAIDVMECHLDYWQRFHSYTPPRKLAERRAYKVIELWLRDGLIERLEPVVGA